MAVETNIEVEHLDGVRVLRLNRPFKKNALTVAMYRTLADALESARTDEKVGALLITGGDSCFSAGNDIQDFLDRPGPGEKHPAIRFIETLALFEKPVIAAVNGIAIGIGTTLLLHCDRVIAGVSARFQTPFVDLGLTPEAGSSLLLPLRAGHGRAASLLLWGETLDAAAAKEAGIVQQVTEDDASFDIALSAAKKIAAKPPQAVLATKRLLRQGHTALLQQQMSDELAEFATRLHSEEARSRFTAFLAKRHSPVSQ